jgi:hypothetical protein
VSEPGHQPEGDGNIIDCRSGFSKGMLNSRKQHPAQIPATTTTNEEQIQQHSETTITELPRMQMKLRMTTTTTTTATI